MRILCLDMDAFFMSVEEATCPHLKGATAAVVGGGKRGVVLSPSYTARKKGVHTGQSTYEALRHCPNVRLVPASFKKYSLFSSRIAAFLKEEINPNAAMYSIDEAFINITDMPENATELAAHMQAWLAHELGITGSVGVGQSYVVSKMACKLKKPNGFYEVSPENTIPFIDGFKLGDIWGIGRHSIANLAEKGMFTPPDVRRYGKDKLMADYGLPGLYIYNACCGIDREYPVGKGGLPKSISRVVTVQEDVHQFDIAMAYLLQLSETVSARARRKLYAGKIISLTVRASDMSYATYHTRLSFFTSATHHIYEVVKAMFIANDCLAQPLRLFGVGLGELSHGGVVLSNMDDMLSGADMRLNSLYKVVDEINSKYQHGLMRGTALKIPYKGDHIAPAFSNIPDEW